MTKLSASVCLIPELASGPFLYSGGLDACCRQAAEAGFDAVELLVPSAEAVGTAELRSVLGKYRLQLSGVSTGGGFLLHRLHLCSSDADVRRRAIAFAEPIIDLAGALGAVAIVGVLKGPLEPGVGRSAAMGWLHEGLTSLGKRAERDGVPLIVEPLNRYESNWVNRLDEGVELIRSLGTRNVKLLADLFHMNIEEVDIAEAIRAAAGHVGHVHFSDSNRRAVGFGHIDCGEIGRTLREIGYRGYLTAEIFPHPNAEHAARQTIRAFREHILAAAEAH